MGLAKYKDKAWLYEYYVKRRMNLTDLVDILDKQYGVKVSPQAVWNWLNKYDLLKYRGKGRKLSRATAKRPESAMAKKAKERRLAVQKKKRTQRRGRRR